MTRWHKRAAKFTVRIAYDKHGRAKATIPAPIIAGLGQPDTLTFALGPGEIIVKFDRLDSQTK